MRYLKQSTARDLKFFASDTSGAAVTGKTDGNWTKVIAKNGGSSASMTVTITEDAGGQYKFTVSTSHTDTLGEMTLMFTATGVVPVVLQYDIVTGILSDLVTGVNVTSMAAGVVTASAIADNAIDAGAIASDAITAAKIATGAITAAKFAADAITSTVVADNTLTAAKLATGAITSAKFAAGAIDAAAIATDAIDADAIKADAITEIQAGLALATAVDTVEASLTTALADLDDIQARLPAALVSGRMDSSTGAMAANVLTAAATHADFTTEVTSGLATSANQTTIIAGLVSIQADTDAIETDTQDIQGRLPATLSSGKMRSQVEGMDANTVTASAVADDAIDAGAIAADALAASELAASAATEIAAAVGSVPSAATVAAAVLNAVLDGATTVRGGLTRIYAQSVGKADNQDGAATYYREDGTTVAFSTTVTNDDRTVPADKSGD